jgi:hypothetical protein
MARLDSRLIVVRSSRLVGSLEQEIHLDGFAVACVRDAVSTTLLEAVGF